MTFRMKGRNTSGRHVRLCPAISKPLVRAVRLKLLTKKEKTMNTKNNEELESVERQPSRAKSLFTGLFVGGLVGAGTVLLLVPQSGAQTRQEVRLGAIHLRDRTTEVVKDRVQQAKSKANQLKTDVQLKAGDLQHQGKDLLAKQLDRVAQAAEARKKAIQNHQSAN
jgi:gas vesicle protein